MILRLAAMPAMQLQVGGGVRARRAAVDALLRCRRRPRGGRQRRGDATDRGRCTGCDASVRDASCWRFDVRLDADGTPRCATHGWQTDEPRRSGRHSSAFRPAGLTHVLCTDVERDGALTGPNLALYAEARATLSRISQWQASGGVRCRARSARAGATGVAAAISGRALLEDRSHPRSCGHSCQTHNSLPRRPRRPGRQGRALPRSPGRGRHPRARRALSRRRRGRTGVLRHHREPDGRTVDRSWVRRVARVLDIPFCVAGGIRSRRGRRGRARTPAPKRSRSTRPRSRIRG